MKKVMLTLCVIFTIAITASAQKNIEPTHNLNQIHQRGNITDELNFSKLQKAQAKSIKEDYRKKMHNINRNEEVTVKVMRDNKEALIKEKKRKMDALLTTEQKTKRGQLLTVKKAKAELEFTNRLAKMKTNLGLSDEQVAQIRLQKTSTKVKMDKLKTSESLSRSEKKEQMRTLKAEEKAQSEQIFTPDQIKKIEEKKKILHKKQVLKNK